MIERAVRAALLEDLGRAGDLTTDSIVPEGVCTTCGMVARQIESEAHCDQPVAWSYELPRPGMQPVAGRFGF